MSMNQDVLVLMPTAWEELILQMHVITSGQRNITKAFLVFAGLLAMAIDQFAKARSLGIKCVSLVDTNFDGFSVANFINNRYLTYMLLCFLLFCGFQGGNKKFTGIGAGSLSRSLISLLCHSLARLCSNMCLLAG